MGFPIREPSKSPAVLSIFLLNLNQTHTGALLVKFAAKSKQYWLVKLVPVATGFGCNLIEPGFNRHLFYE